MTQGVTINGLVILSERPLPWNPEHTNPPGGLPKYFEDNVIGGPGSFVIVAEDFKSFGQALISKTDRGDREPAAPHRHAAHARAQPLRQFAASRLTIIRDQERRTAIRVCAQRRSADF